MRIIRHPKLAEDIRAAAKHYGEISDRIRSSFWKELDSALASVQRNPRSHHYDSCGLRRINFQKFPYHLLFEVENDEIYLVVLRHDKRIPSYGIDRRP